MEINFVTLQNHEISIKSLNLTQLDATQLNNSTQQRNSRQLGSNGCMELANSRDSDTSWYTKISVRDTGMLPFRLPPEVDHAGCGWLTITTISNNEYSGANTERAENKINLLDVMFF
jgi:hypothetical protein